MSLSFYPLETSRLSFLFLFSQLTSLGYCILFMLPELQVSLISSCHAIISYDFAFKTAAVYSGQAKAKRIWQRDSRHTQRIFEVKVAQVLHNR
jgi:hypothetical protein